ncbi:hypothetical protein GEMRC1_003817 [Eukaryota sp. GEM-RC1]
MTSRRTSSAQSLKRSNVESLDTIDDPAYLSCSSPPPSPPRSKQLTFSKCLLTQLIVHKAVDRFEAKPSISGLIPALSTMLEGNTTLRELDLSKSSINDDECLSLAQSLQHTKLRNSVFTSVASGCVLVNSLPSLLRQLDLSGNCLGDACITILAANLHHLKFLESLTLDKNGVGNPGAVTLAGALRENTSLKELFLKRNSIQKEGCLKLLEMLLHNNSLRALDLSVNRIGDGINEALLVQSFVTVSRTSRGVIVNPFTSQIELVDDVFDGAILHGLVRPQFDFLLPPKSKFATIQNVLGLMNEFGYEFPDMPEGPIGELVHWTTKI